MKNMYADKPMYRDNEASRLKSRHAMEEKMHNEANAFVKEQQNAVKKYAGHEPRPDARMGNMGAFMSNDGNHAVKFAEDLTRGLDKTAFPVFNKMDKTQK